MTKTLIALVAFSLVVVAPGATADKKPSESYADCEANQPWIGYTSTNSTRDFYQQKHDQLRGEKVPVPHLRTCEGEHWDGEDNVQPDRNPGYEPGCSDVDEVEQDDVAAAQRGEANLFAGNCMDRDPTAGDQTVPGHPLGFRVSVLSEDGVVQTYAALDIYGVGRAIVYLGACQGNAENQAPGLEGKGCAAESKTGRQARGAAYVQDNSDQVFPGTPVLATIVSALGITRGYPSPNDCDQSTYEEGAYENDRTLCGRDNTAITVESLIP